MTQQQGMIGGLGLFAALIGGILLGWAQRQDNPYTAWAETSTSGLVAGWVLLALGMIAVLAALIGMATTRR